MINCVEINNFKSLRNVRIDLEPLTVFVGANASGKTSVLDAIHYAVRASTGKPEQVFGYERHCDWLYTRGGVGDMQIACTTPTGKFSLIAQQKDIGLPSEVEFLGRGRWDFIFLPEDKLVFADALESVEGTVFLHFNAVKLAKPSYSRRVPPRVEFTGQGLASVLAYMALNDPDSFEELVDKMRTLIPHLRRIRFTKEKVTRTEKELVRFGKDAVERPLTRDFQGDAILFDFKNANNVGAHTVSEGTLMLLGLVTVLMGPIRPKVLLLDDIEHGLHPLAQKSLMVVLRQLMEKFSHLQILASSHSPYLLDQLQPQEIRLMTTGDDGYALCGRLDEHPQFEKWKDEMAPGEMWSLFGEKWVAGQGAQH